MLNEASLPSLKALRTFVAVANNLSFSKAAKELFVTQSAVSKQISALEQQLGQPLFSRHLNGIQLSHAAETYLPKIIEALEIIQYATSSLIKIDHAEEVLTLDVTPSFASLWLIPRIEEFHRLNKKIQVRIQTGDGQIKQNNGGCDISVRCFPISQHYENAVLLRRENLVLVASPKLLNVNPIVEMQDIQKHILIPHITRPHLWEQFKRANNLAYKSRYSATGFEHFYMSLEAVKDGLGLALLPDFMIKGALKNNTLINPLNLSMETSYGYYILVPSYRLSSRKIYEFSRWLNGKLGKESTIY